MKRSALVLLSALGCASASAASVTIQTSLSLAEAVREAVAHNSSVRAAKANYETALHQVAPVYAPQDPQVGIQRVSTPNGLSRAQQRSVGVSESFQFPGTAWLQGGQARRAAEIARLAYLAAARDATAQVQTAYYQTLLDSASVSINRENELSVKEVLEVARIGYTADQGAQTDLISAQFALSQASQAVLASQVALANDEASLNVLLLRHPETPLQLTSDMEIKPLELAVDAVKGKALAARQEVLEAAITEKNAETARRLAWMELLPALNVSWAWNSYPPGSTSSIEPQGPYRDFSSGLSFSVPVFFWFHQREDIHAASRLLEAARANLDGVQLQTESNVTQLFRSAQLAYKAAVLNRDVLVPLASQNLRVALIAYQSKKIDFSTLAGILQSLYAARVSYLTAANQFLAGRVALDQAMGGPLAR